MAEYQLGAQVNGTWQMGALFEAPVLVDHSVEFVAEVGGLGAQLESSADLRPALVSSADFTAEVGGLTLGTPYRAVHILGIWLPERGHLGMGVYREWLEEWE